MSDDPETLRPQRARRAAGWQWVKLLVPPDLHRQLRGIASAYGLTPTQAILDGLMYAVQQAPRPWWRGRGQAHKDRFTRRDAGRRRAGRQAPQGDGSGPKTPEA